MTASPLLETKFHLPVAHGRHVPRARLSDQIARATNATLTLVSAPAGFGKSTVMAELAARSGDSRIAWLSLDPGDNDPVTFWTYVIEALDRAAPGVGGAARSILTAGQGTVDAAVTTLLNGLAAAAGDVVLVLDDVHVIESPAIHQELGYFLDHLPATAHVVMGTRADPAIPLARLRARGALVEIRANDLRFSGTEAASYLGAMGISITDDDVATLEARTEGWIAALQLAALSLQDRADATGFISAFASDDRYIVDYLVEEVLRRQPAETRDFLLKTSILARFTGPLADAVTDGRGGAATIEALDRANLFLVALDNQRRWYRYHHLFGGVLQAYLAAERPNEVRLLHRRASDWFEQNGERGEAIEHAMRAGDFDHAADLIELDMPQMRQFRREPTFRRWVAALPPDVVAQRPVLAVSYASTILSANQVEGVDELLTTAERRIAAGDPIVVVDEAEFQRLSVMTELYRAALAKMLGDLEGNLAHARRVLELVADTDHLARGGAAAFLGLAYWGMGDLEAGYRWYAEGMAELEKGGLVADLVGGAIVRADMRLAEGRLGDAMRIFEDGLSLATRGELPLRGVTDMHTGLADVAYQRGRLDEARAQLDARRQFGDELGFPRDPYRSRLVGARILQAEGDVGDAVRLLDEGRRFGDELGFPRDPYRSRLVGARILQAEGDVGDAVRLLAEAERLYLSEYSPDIHPVPAIRARLHIAHGRLADARAWADGTRLTSADELTYVREYEHLTLARLLVAEAAGGDAGAMNTALELLDRLLAAAEGRRDGSRLEILVVQALARHTAGDATGAFGALDAALQIAEPEGYVRVFLDEGPPMARLLRASARRSGAPGYVHRLLGAGERSPAAARPSARAGGLIEPLSDRELDVLRLLRSELDGPDIASELFVSVNTLRTHTKNIYSKLGVGNRRAAIRRAEELRLI